MHAHTLSDTEMVMDGTERLFDITHGSAGKRLRRIPGGGFRNKRLAAKTARPTLGMLMVLSQRMARN
jgi:hypothetical protein